MAVELVCRRVFNPILIMSILGRMSTTCNNGGEGTYTVFFFIEHEGSDGLTLVGMDPSLSSNTDSSTANAKLVGSARDGVEGRRHCVKDMMEEITGVIDGGTTSQWCSLYLFLVRTIAGPECMDHLTQLRVQPHSHHHNPPLLLPTNQWRNECAPLFVMLTHMMS